MGILYTCGIGIDYKTTWSSQTEIDIDPLGQALYTTRRIFALMFFVNPMGGASRRSSLRSR